MRWFYNLKLAVKIALLSVNFLVFILIIGIMGFVSIRNENNDFKSLNNDRLIPVYDLAEARSHIQNMRLAARTHISADSITQMEELEKDIEKNEIELQEHIGRYSQKYLVEDEVKGLEAFKKAYAEYKESRDKTIKYSKENKTEMALANANGDAKVKYDKTIKAIEDLIQIQIRVAEELYNISEARYGLTMVLFPLLFTLSIVLGIVLSILTIQAVVKPVRKVTNKLVDISGRGGDLTQRIGINGKDEIGTLSREFDGFMDKLQSIIKGVVDSAQTIASSSEQLSYATSETNKALEQIGRTVNEIAAGTSDSVSVVEETTASLNEAARFSENTAVSSKKTTENSLIVRSEAEEGSLKVNEIVESMSVIKSSSVEVSDVIADLDKSSRRIGDIVQLITGIAEQTNLLALNAAIEAARAGEAGRGFNIVAEEIRKLAESSSNAAREIITLVRENRSKTEIAVKTVEEVNAKVEEGVKKAEDVKAKIDNIIINIKDIVKQIGSINSDIEKQAVITEEINKAMGNIASVANETAAGTEEMSASVEEQVGTMEEIEATAHQLSEMAARLNSITSGFRV